MLESVSLFTLSFNDYVGNGICRTFRYNLKTVTLTAAGLYLRDNYFAITV